MAGNKTSNKLIEWCKQHKIIMAIIALLIISIVINGVTKNKNGVGSSGPSEPISTQQASQNPQDIIKAAVRKDLSGTNDVQGNYYRNVDVVAQESGGYGVFVDYNGDETGSSNSEKTLYTEKAEQLYKTIYSQTGQDVRTASVSAWFAGTDQYGNDSDKLVYKTILDKAVADKVNWKADDATLQIDLPSLWSVTLNFL